MLASVKTGRAACDTDMGWSLPNALFRCARWIGGQLPHQSFTTAGNQPFLHTHMPSGVSHNHRHPHCMWDVTSRACATRHAALDGRHCGLRAGPSHNHRTTVCACTTRTARETVQPQVLLVLGDVPRNPHRSLAHAWYPLKSAACRAWPACPPPRAPSLAAAA